VRRYINITNMMEVADLHICDVLLQVRAAIRSVCPLCAEWHQWHGMAWHGMAWHGMPLHWLGPCAGNQSAWLPAAVGSMRHWAGTRKST
jgi:hypothetical protein